MVDPFLREPQQVPGVQENSNAPSAQKLAKRQRLYRVGVYTTLFAVVPLTLLTSLAVLSATSKEQPVDFASLSTGVNSSKGRGAATLAVQNWLASTPEPLPGGVVISWDGYETLTVPEDETGVKPLGYKQEVHKFTLASGGQLFDSQVVVFVDDTLGTSTPSTPSLLPRFTGSSSNISGASPWVGFEMVSAPKNLDVAVQAWADALVSGDRNRLTQVTGDPTETNLYLPLYGVVSAEAEVVSVAVPKLQSSSGKQKPAQVVAQVTLRLVWEGADPEEDGATLVTYDVLVDQANTVSPKVVSWGGPGSAPSLTPFSVAVKNVTAPPTQTGESPTGPSDPSATAENGEVNVEN